MLNYIKQIFGTLPAQEKRTTNDINVIWCHGANQTYALDNGSSQALRREKIMNWIESYTPAAVTTVNVPAFDDVARVNN